MELPPRRDHIDDAIDDAIDGAWDDAIDVEARLMELPPRIPNEDDKAPSPKYEGIIDAARANSRTAEVERKVKEEMERLRPWKPRKPSPAETARVISATENLEFAAACIANGTKPLFVGKLAGAPPYIYGFDRNIQADLEAWLASPIKKPEGYLEAKNELVSRIKKARSSLLTESILWPLAPVVPPSSRGIAVNVVPPRP